MGEYLHSNFKGLGSDHCKIIINGHDCLINYDGLNNMLTLGWICMGCIAKCSFAQKWHVVNIRVSGLNRMSSGMSERIAVLSVGIGLSRHHSSVPIGTSWDTLGPKYRDRMAAHLVPWRNWDNPVTYQQLNIIWNFRSMFKVSYGVPMPVMLCPCSDMVYWWSQLNIHAPPLLQSTPGCATIGT